MAVDPALTSGAVVQCVTFCRTSEGQNQQNTMGWKIGTRFGEWTCQRLADAFSPVFADVILGLLPVAHSYLGVKVRRVSEPRTQLFPSTVGTDVGLRAGNALPSQTTALISRRSGAAPPGSRGRFFVPSTVVADNTAGGDPAAGYLTDLVAMADFLKTVLTVVDGGDSLELLPHLLKISSAGVLLDSWQIDSTLIRTRWATQRRRGEINRPDVVPF